MVFAIFISVCYLADKIVDYFGDGKKWGVKITYVFEEQPLGTAGALKLIPENLNHPLLVINGDVLTKTNFRDVFSYHESNKGEVTICVREHVLQSPYG